jgi:hypothetical protein
MPAVSVARPVVRSFEARFAREAAAHVRAGGHALVWEGKTHVRLVFRAPRKKNAESERDLGYWSLLDLGKDRWTREKSGPLRGLAVAPVARDSVDIVKRRAARDAVHPGATRRVRFDCETCAACCRDNKVVLEPIDFQRFKAAGREELARPPFTRKDGDRVVLRLLRSRDCRHLQADKRCGIYIIRPDSCRSFPVASEGCLYSREVELGLVDGAPG